ncbi:MAG: hypothetical protein NTV34_11715 [Proteobacteria bacterium]|nr:hypothetical protein [Pseudomonadota bacterium]
MNKPCFSNIFRLNSKTLILFVVAQLAIVFLDLIVPGRELISYEQPFEHGSEQAEPESGSESNDRTSAETDVRLSRSSKAPSRLDRVFVRTIVVPRSAEGDIGAIRFVYFSMTVFSPTLPSVFRTLPLII